MFIGTVWPGTTAFPDFLHDNSTAYWTQMVQTFLSTVPIDGLWIDSMTLRVVFSTLPVSCLFLLLFFSVDILHLFAPDFFSPADICVFCFLSRSHSLAFPLFTVLQ